MRLQHFADLAAIFQERFMKPLWERYPQRETDPWDSLGLFMEGYAFERQGRRPDYGPAAADAIIHAKSKGYALETGDAHQSVWKSFKDYFDSSKLNEANNPLCPQGTRYTHRNRFTLTSNKKSVIEVLCGMLDSEFSRNIVVFAKNGLWHDRLKAVHDTMREIKGIGPKIASLFLRDVATFYSTFPSKDRHLLQPVDVWVRRIAKELGGPVTDLAAQNLTVDEEVAKWIVRESAAALVNPEAVNQGMWYFAREIAGSYYRLGASIHDLGRAKELFAQHKEGLSRAAQAATIVRIQP